MSIGDSINFLPAVQEITGLTPTDSYRFLSLAVYLRNNYVTSCFKHRYFDLYFFDYRPTTENNYIDQRYILLADQKIWTTKGSQVESYQLIDRKENLILIGPADVKVK